MKRSALLVCVAAVLAGCDPCVALVCGPGGVEFVGLPVAPRCSGPLAHASPHALALGSTWTVTAGGLTLGSTDPSVLSVSGNQVTAVGVGNAFLTAGSDAVRVSVRRPETARLAQLEWLLRQCPPSHSVLRAGEPMPTLAVLFDAEGASLAGDASVVGAEPIVPAVSSLLVSVQVPDGTLLEREIRVVEQADRIERGGAPWDAIQALSFEEGDPPAEVCFVAMNGEDRVLVPLTFESDTGLAFDQTLPWNGTDACVILSGHRAGSHVLSVSGGGIRRDVDVPVRLAR